MASRLNVTPLALEGFVTKAYRWYVLAVLATAYAVHAMDRSIINLILEPIRRDFRLSDSALGLMTGLGYAAPFAIAGLPLGAVADRGSRKNLLATLLTVWSGMTAIGGLAGGYGALLGTRMAVGAAESGSPPTALALVSDYFEPRVRALAVSIFYLGAPLGAIFAAKLAGAITPDYGWRGTLFVASVPGFILALLIWLTVKDRARGLSDIEPITQPGRVQPSFLEVFQFIGRHPGLALTIVALVLSSLAIVGISTWIPALLMRHYALSMPDVGSLVAKSGWVGLLGTLLGGWLALAWARGQSRRLLVLAGLSNLLQVPALLVAVNAPDVRAFAPSFYAWTIFHTVYYGAGFSLVLSLSPSAMRARVTAATFVLANILGAGLGPQIIGLLSDALHPVLAANAIVVAVESLGGASLAAGLLFLSAIRRVPAGIAQPLE